MRLKIDIFRDTITVEEIVNCWVDRVFASDENRKLFMEKNKVKKLEKCAKESSVQSFR